MTNPPIMPNVTIVSSDTALLRETSWTLSCFGYRATTSTDWSDAALWRRHGDGRIFLFDGRDFEATRKALAEPRGINGEVRIVMLTNDTSDDASSSLVAAADDAISLPIAAFELLARLRGAVRRLEYESRVRESASYPLVDGVLSQAGFSRAVQEVRSHSMQEQLCLLALEIDFRNEAIGLLGTECLSEFESSIADVIQIQLADQSLGQTAAGQFLVLLDGCDENEAQAVGQRILECLARQSLRPRLRRTQLTLTALAKQLEDGSDIADQIECALALLQHGSALGGNIVLRASEVQAALDDWQQSMEAGTPFESAVACDVMEAFPAVINQNDISTLSRAIAYRTNNGGHDTVPPCIPVLSDNGLLLGILSVAALNSTMDPSFELGPSGLASAASVEFDLPLSEMLDAFAHHECDLLVVCEQDVPIGYVTRESIGKLFEDSIDASRYQLSDASRSNPERFVVPLDGYATAP